MQWDNIIVTFQRWKQIWFISWSNYDIQNENKENNLNANPA